MKELQIKSSLNPIAKIFGCSITSTGLDIPENSTDEEFSSVGCFISTSESASQWWIADYYIAAGKRYGETYEDDLPFANQTKRNCVMVGRSFEKSRRRDNPVTFAHHAEVASLDPREQDQWLDLAEKHKLSVRSLRRSISAGKLLLDNHSLIVQPKGLSHMTADSLSVFFNSWQRQIIGKRKSLEYMQQSELVILEKNLREPAILHSRIVSLLQKNSI